MDEKEYTSLLDKAYADLPAVINRKGRFEVPTVKGRLVKSRTIITNFRDISKTLSRDEIHCFKFVLKEVGVRGDINEKGEVTLFSRFQPAMLNKAISKYFKTYVECTHCTSPDTIFINDNTFIKCNACGHQEKIPKL